MEQAGHKKANFTKKTPHPFILKGGDLVHEKMFLNIFSWKQKEEGAAGKKFIVASWTKTSSFLMTKTRKGTKSWIKKARLMYLYFVSLIIQTQNSTGMILFFSHSLSCPNKKLSYVLFAGLVNIYIYICSCYKTQLNTQMRKVNTQILANERIFSFCLAASTKISSKKLI